MTRARDLADLGSGITSGDLADDSITTAKIAGESVNESKLQVSNAPTNGYFLSAQSGNTGGMTWAEAGGGKILQVTHAFNDTYASASAGQLLSAVEANITPTSASSRIVISTNGNFYYNSGFELWLYRDGTLLEEYQSLSRNNWQMETVHFVDTPNTTSSVSYKFRISAGGTVYVNNNSGGSSTMILMEANYA